MVKYLEYKGIQLPIRVSYRALQGFKKDTGLAFEELEGNTDLEHFESLLYHALASGYAAGEEDMPYAREQIVDILDECFFEFTGLIPSFFPKVMPVGNEKPSPVKKGSRKQ